MAERRMFAKSITNSDAFLDLPATAQNLYFHLNMNADDDGFVNKPKSIMRMIGSHEGDMKALIEKSFVILFDSGVIVIKHWRMNNYLRNDRHHSTNYQEEFNSLSIKENGTYTLGIPTDNQVVDNGYTEVRLGKVSKGKSNLKENILKEKTEPCIQQNSEEDLEKQKSTRFTTPTLEEVKQYCKENDKAIDPEYFWNFYESKGWYVGKNKMKNWHSAIATWERNSNNQVPKPSIESKEYYDDDCPIY